MIYEVKMYGCKCDGCGFEYQDIGYSCWPDVSTLIDFAEDDGWYVTTKHKIYCQNCYIIDEDDNYIILSK